MNRWVFGVALLFWAFASFGEEEQTRTFPEYKCSYTLPGPNWKWGVPKSDAGAVFMASNTEGYAVALMARAYPLKTITPKDAELFDKGAKKHGESTYRGGTFTTFKNLVCYQQQLNHPASRKTFASNYFIAHGNIYTVQVFGSSEPIESLPVFEVIMNGFSFTVPPEASAAPAANPNSYEYSKGTLTVFMVVGALILLIAGKTFKGK